MDITLFTASLIYQIGVTLGVGAATFALIFYIQAFQDGVYDSTERRVLRTVSVVLRLAMAMILLAGITIALIVKTKGGNVLTDPMFVFQMGVFAVIFINSFMMTFRYMPLWLGPAIAAGSWYAFFLARVVPPPSTEYPFLILVYLAFLCLVFAMYTYIKKIFTRASELPSLSTGDSDGDIEIVIDAITIETPKN